ncbi:hypothetical protein JXB41_02215 [Candidatus Woesearchaeota archaeon]|nr:hypothetical protein [Candidatus Woesearchaeota archaeon]
MKKRGQLTIFIIIGLLILIVFGLIMCSIGKSKEELKYEQEKIVNLDAQRESIENFVSICLRRLFEEAKDKFGIDESQKGNYINYIKENIMDCVDFDLLESGGLDVYPGVDINPEVDITENVAYVKLNWKLTLKKAGSEIILDEFTYSFPRVFEIELPLDPSGKTTDPIGISSPDDDLTIIIPEGTLISNCPQPISIYVDNIEDSERDEANICNIKYDLTDHGCEFNPPAEVHFTYPSIEGERSPTAGRTDEVTFGVYESATDTWYVVPCYTDTENEEIICFFRRFGLVSCIESNEAEILPEDLDPYVLDPVTGKPIQCPIFYPALSSANTPCVCGNNVIYWVDPSIPFLCIPDTADEIISFYNSWLPTVEIPFTKEMIKAEVQVYYPSLDISNPVSVDDFIKKNKEYFTGYEPCTYHGRTFTKQELIKIGNPKDYPSYSDYPVELGRDLTKWRPDTVPCQCSDRFFIHSPIRTDDPFLCYIG